MADNYSAGCEVTLTNSAIEQTERKRPLMAGLQVPKHELTISATLTVCSFVSRASPCRLAFKGRFTSRRTPHDSNGPHPGCAEENGIGICESSSQRCNSEIIRLARRNHKPGGADLAGSVHVVRSLSG